VSNVPPPPPPGAAPPPPPPPSEQPGTMVQPQTGPAYDPAPTTPVAEPTSTIAVAGPANLKILGAEMVGTFVLMIVGPGTAILAADMMGTLGIAFAFGLVLLAMAYSIGHISGCHINPAVTLGFWLTRKVTLVQAAYYWVAQAAGAILGGFVLFVLTSGGDNDKTGVFASNGWGDELGVPFGLGAAIVVEVVFTALLVFVVLSTTTKGYPVGFGGIAAGLTLGMIHLATIPVDNTSVNPARSLGTALFAGWDHLAQLWVFIIFPLVGAALGVLVWLLVHEERLEDTMFGNHTAVVAARDRAAGAAGNVAGKVDDRLG
jgi:aquaporin Z